MQHAHTGSVDLQAIAWPSRALHVTSWAYYEVSYVSLTDRCRSGQFSPTGKPVGGGAPPNARMHSGVFKAGSQEKVVTWAFLTDRRHGSAEATVLV